MKYVFPPRFRAGRRAARSGAPIRRAGLGPRGTQRALGRLAAALQRRLWREVARRSARGHRVLRGAARPAVRLSLAGSSRFQVLRAAAAAHGGRSGDRHRRRDAGGVSAGQDLWSAFAPWTRGSRSRCRARCASLSPASRGRRQRTSRVDPATGIVTFLPGHLPAAGAAVTAGFEFDVPVRFDTDRLEIISAGLPARCHSRTFRSSRCADEADATGACWRILRRARRPCAGAGG